MEGSEDEEGGREPKERRGNVRTNVAPGEARRGSADISVWKTVGLSVILTPSLTSSILMVGV